MLSWIREKFGTAVIGSIIVFIAFVFIFYGVFSPKSTRGLHEGAVAGTVNGEPISIGEFNREFNRRMEYFRSMGAVKFTDEQLKKFKLREAVFRELVNRRLLIQELNRQGLMTADDQVREKIEEMAAFQKDGKFSWTTYRQVLGNNNYTPAGFEKLMREDISIQQWDGYFKNRVHASDDELKKEFLISEDQRKIKYVVIARESFNKKLEVSTDEIKKFLGDASQLNRVKMKFDEAKDTIYRGQKFEEVQETMARNLLAAQKRDEAKKLNLNLAEQIMPMMKLSKNSDSKINQFLKPYQLEVKISEFLTRQNFSLPQVGLSQELMKDSFSEKSPIHLDQGGKPKKYEIGGQLVVAAVVQSKNPDLEKLKDQREELLKKILQRKSRQLQEDSLNKLNDKAKIETNPAVVSSDETAL